eukprot:TRINITY_DN2677_c0_g1_i2.p1 TRINITY_DN2677_c0_g1~~TRINITY_DN2677_c0_g1_i2.p1  ORF type:complete len:785 (-),score=287.16 TRINITY_DN2677_c0_g1_i2:180-2534(-)
MIGRMHFDTLSRPAYKKNPLDRPTSERLTQHQFVARVRATTVLLDLIARTKNAVRDLDNLNYRKMKKILMNDNCDEQSTIGDDDVSVSDMNEEDEEGASSSKSNSVTSEQSTGISASSQGSLSQNNNPGGGPPLPSQSLLHHAIISTPGSGGGGGGLRQQPHHHHHHYNQSRIHHSPHINSPSSSGRNHNPSAVGAAAAALNASSAGPSGSGSHPEEAAAPLSVVPQPPSGFHRTQIYSEKSLSAQEKFNPQKLLSSPGGDLAGDLSGACEDDSTLDPKNFATIRTTSIVQRQQKEHLQEEMHEQMSGYKRLRRDHQASLSRLEEQCRQEMEKHKVMLDRDYEGILGTFSRELERLQLKHQEELGKKLKNNLNTEKKLIKEVSDLQSVERKSFETKMKAEYKMKKERWKKEMAEIDTPKRQREAMLSQRKENLRESDAAESQKMSQGQKGHLDLEIRKFRRRRLLKYQELEQELLKEELNKRQNQLETAHSMLLRHHELTYKLECKQQRGVHSMREDHVKRQHLTELSNQEEYTRRLSRELKKKHALEIKQQPKSLKQKEILIRKQFRDTVKIQTRQYKAFKAQILNSTPKEELKPTIRKLKEEQRRKMALLGEQYEQTIADMLQKQSIRMDESQELDARSLSERLQSELESLTAHQSKSRIIGEQQRTREKQELEDRVSVRRTLLEQKMEEESSQFLQERAERIRLLHERQLRELEQFDEESTRLGFSAMSIAESSNLPGYGEDSSSSPLTHSHSSGGPLGPYHSGRGFRNNNIGSPNQRTQL